LKYLWSTLAGAERSSALQRAGLAQVMPTHKPHFVPGDLQFLTSNTYRRAKLLESDRLLAAELRSAPAGATRPISKDWAVVYLTQQGCYHVSSK